MIAPPGARQRHWQSPDGMIEVGEAQLGSLTYIYASLGPRPIHSADIKGLMQALKKAPATSPLLLLSCCPGFTISATEEAEGLVFYAGAYRAMQQEHKATGRLLLSYIEQVAVGGVYLMQGLAAHRRAVAEGTLFYDTVPNRPPVGLAQAQARGLVDDIISPTALEGWILAAVAEHALQTQP